MNAQEPNPGFHSWLYSSESLFWISGKPGCGKSTLLKYTLRILQTQPEILSNRNPKIASFFFYQQGQQQEKSFVGLLHSLIYQIISSSKNLLALFVVYFKKQLPRIPGHERNQPDNDYAYPGAIKYRWTETSLKEGLRFLAQRAIVPEVLLVFIDGLDECEGDHGKQLDFLLDWIGSLQQGALSVKLCVSSRPLPAIDTRLRRFPGFKVHDWTASDISSYIERKLTDAAARLDDGFPLSTNKGEREIDLEHLISEITRKAQGVFVWVRVVVTNMISGMEDGNTKAELESQLSKLPDDIRPLYAAILKQIPSAYLEDTILYFRTLRAMKDWKALPTPFLGLYEFTLAHQDPAEALSCGIQALEKPTTMDLSHMEQMRLRLQSRCRGLIQIQVTHDELYRHAGSATPIARLESGGFERVEYLHLTVREFLDTELVNIVRQRKVKIDMDRDQNFALMAMQLRLIKTYRTQQPKWSGSRHKRTIKTSGYYAIGIFLTFAAFADTNSRASISPFVDELDRVNTLWARDWHTKFYMEWQSPRAVEIQSHVDMLSIAALAGLSRHINERLQFEESLLVRPHGYPLLCSAADLSRQVSPGPGFEKSEAEDPRYIPWSKKVPVITSLFSHGADPNQQIHSSTFFTAWGYILTTYPDLVWLHESSLDIVKTFLVNGADPNVKVWGPPSSAGFNDNRSKAKWSRPLHMILEFWGTSTKTQLGFWLAHGADPTLGDEKGVSALAMAERHSIGLRDAIVRRADRARMERGSNTLAASQNSTSQAQQSSRNILPTTSDLPMPAQHQEFTSGDRPLGPKKSLRNLWCF